MGNTIREVGIALYNLDTIDKYEKEFHKNPAVFKLRANINDEVFEIPRNEFINNEIQNYFNLKRKENQKIVDDNPEVVKTIENMP